MRIQFGARGDNYDYKGIAELRRLFFAIRVKK
jgi:hypothetical protein